MRLLPRKEGPLQAAPPLSELSTTGIPASWRRMVVTGLADELDAQRLRLLMTGVHSLQLPYLVLEVWSTAETVELSLCADSSALVQMNRVIRAMYPEWHTTPAEMVTPSASRFDSIGQIQLGDTPSWQPLPSIQQVAGHDPLSSILAVEPDDGESVLLRLLVAPASAEQRQKLWKELHLPAPVNGWSDLLATTIGGATIARYEPKVQQELEERVRGPLFSLFGVVIISGNQLERIDSFQRSLAAAFVARFGLQLSGWRYSDGTLVSGRHVPPQPIICAPQELVVLWHPVSKAVATPRIKRLRWPSSILPKEVLQSDGMLVGLHQQQGQMVPVSLSFHDGQQGPIVILGRTGYGKSEFKKQLIYGQMQRSDKPSLYVIDPNGKLATEIISQCIPDSRVGSSYLLEFDNQQFIPRIALFSPPDDANEVQVVQFVEATVSVLKLIFDRANITPRMEDVLFALVATLARMPSATLIDANKLFTNRAFRKRIVRRLVDIATLEFWVEYDQLSDTAQREMVSPVIRRLRSLYRSPSLRRIFCQRSGEDSTQQVDGHIIANNLAGSAIASGADLIGEILIARTQMNTYAKMDNPHTKHPPLIFAVDESQRYSGAALPILLREARKTNITTMLATQYMDAWGESLMKSVSGNFGTLACFSVSQDDAKKLSASLSPFTSDQIQTLNRYEAIIRMQYKGQTLPAFDVKTVMVEDNKTKEEMEQILEEVKKRTRQRFTRPVAEVDAEIAESSGFSASLAGSDEELPTEDIYED